MPRLQTSRILVPRNTWRAGSAGHETLIALTVLTLAVVLALRRRVRHVVVAGASMSPTLQHGDRLVILRTGRQPRAGELALSPDPRAPERMLIKRVHTVADGRADLRGDHTLASTDSRTFGTVPLRAVEACVAIRYHPVERAGLVSQRRAGAGRFGRHPAARR